MKILVTGAAGFIGFHLTVALLNKGFKVIGLDNLNNYYDPELKKSRLKKISENINFANFDFFEADISNKDFVSKLFHEYNFDFVINLAAQAGVRYSIENPHTYIDSNILGFLNILEGCKNSKVKHLVFASSSSVYGMNKNQPFNTDDKTDYPISLYAASKKSNELMAYTYSHLFNIPTTGLRFFTVYGPYGRPDMAYYKFTKSIINGEPISIYNNGKMHRDFTYIDDIVEGITRVMEKTPISKENIYTSSSPKYSIYNIGNNKPISLNTFIGAIEKACDMNAIKKSLPMQPGDVPITFADIDSLYDFIEFKPTTNIDDGIKKFVDWYKDYHLEIQ